MPMPVHHIALRSADPGRVAAFYRDLLGLLPLRVTDGGSHWLWLGAGAVLMVEPRGADEPEVPAGAMDFLALAMDTPELAGFEARCATLGVAIEHRTQATRYLRDPDGRRVGVSCYRFDPGPLA